MRDARIPSSTLRRFSRRTGFRTGLTGAAAAFVAACGGGGDKESKSGAGGSAGTAASGSQQETPRQGGIISQRLTTDPPSLDVHQTTTYTSLWPTAPCFNQLVQFEPDKPDDSPQDIVADLAEQWQQPDPTTLVFTLRKGVTWHDGSGFTAEDVKVQIDWLRKPPQGKVHPRQGAFATVDTVEAPDPSTVRLKLSRPSPSLTMNLASHYFTIGQAKDIVANGEIGPKLIGTGPFKLKTYQRSNLWELEKNPNYHVSGRPYLDGLKFYILPDLSTSVSNAIAGQYQFLWDVQFKPSDQQRIKSEAPDKFDLPLVPSLTRDLVFTNARRKPYDDIRVRQAISLALDRDAAIKVVREDAARRGGYMAPSGVWAIPEGDLKKYDGYDKPDIMKAKQLLTAAGVTTLEASATTRTDFKDLAEFAKDQLAKIGINLKLTLGDVATAQPVLQRGDFDIAPFLIGINVDDPDATFSEISTSDAVRNWSAVKDPQIDALYAKQSTLLDFNERKKVVQELERHALAQYQVALLFFEDLAYAKAKTMRNFTIHTSLFTNRRMESTWLKQ